MRALTMIEQLKPFAEVKDNSSSLDIDNYDFLSDKTAYDNYIFDLRNIEDKLNHRETWITIRGSKTCKHEQVEVETGICTSCGAYHHPLGAEVDSIDYYKHIYLIAQKLDADTVMFITERYYPADFSIGLFDTFKLENKYKKVYTKTLISGFGKLWKLKRERFDNLYLVLFTNKLQDNIDDFLVANDFEYHIANIIEQMRGSRVYYDKTDIPEYFNHNTKYKGFEKLFYNSKKQARNIFE